MIDSRHPHAQLAGLAAACFGAVAIAAAVVHGYAAALAIAMLVAGAIFVGWSSIGSWLPALLLLLSVNGIPGFDVERFAAPGSFRPGDVFFLGLIAVAALCVARDGRSRAPRLQRWLWVWMPVFVAAWLFAVAQGMDRGATWVQAALFGREFLYFAVLAPLAGALFSDPSRRDRILWIVALDVGLLSLLTILASLRIIGPELVHPNLTHDYGAITRLYTPAGDLIVVGFCLSLNDALLGSGRRRRWTGLLAALTGLACALFLTRALYVGLAIGLAVALGLWLIRSDRPSDLLRRRLAVGVTASVVGLLVVLAAWPAALRSGPAASVSARIDAGVANLSGGRSVGENTLGVREDVADHMLGYLGDRWPTGVGFAPPSALYVVDLPNGSIRDSDVGVLNGVMTMGALGTVLLYVPMLLMLLLAFRQVLSRTLQPRVLVFGLLAWGVTVVASSVTLGALYSFGGLTVVALTLGLACHVLDTAGRGQAGSPPSRRGLPR